MAARSSAQFHIYRSKKDGLWRWRLAAVNGEIIAQGESHTRRLDALRAALLVGVVAPSAAIVSDSEDAASE